MQCACLPSAENGGEGFIAITAIHSAVSHSISEFDTAVVGRGGLRTTEEEEEDCGFRGHFADSRLLSSNMRPEGEGGKAWGEDEDDEGGGAE